MEDLQDFTLTEFEACRVQMCLMGASSIGLVVLVLCNNNRLCLQVQSTVQTCYFIYELTNGQGGSWKGMLLMEEFLDFVCKGKKHFAFRSHDREWSSLVRVDGCEVEAVIPEGLGRYPCQQEINHRKDISLSAKAVHDLFYSVAIGCCGADSDLSIGVLPLGGQAVFTVTAQNKFNVSASSSLQVQYGLKNSVVYCVKPINIFGLINVLDQMCASEVHVSLEKEWIVFFAHPVTWVVKSEKPGD
jgi:hypothetical protein